MMDTPSYYHSLDEHLHAIKRYSRGSPVFSRDFAYADSSPMLVSDESRMVDENIADFSAASFAELLSGPTIDIYVGRERKQWTLHKNLLCQYSSYFETELRGFEVPIEERDSLDLPDDDPRGFELLVKYLYQGRLDNNTVEQSDEDRYEYAVSCQKLHTLSTRLRLPSLSNLAIDVYRANLNAAQLVPDAEEITEIYHSSPPGSKMRQLMVRIAARQIMDPAVNKNADAYRDCFEENADFAIELVNAIREMMGGGMLFQDPTKAGNECRWHEHEEGSPCSTDGMVSAVPKVASPSVRRRQPAGADSSQSTPRKLQIRPSQPPTKPDAPSTTEVLQPTTFAAAAATPKNAAKTSKSPGSAQSKPRKLDRSPTSTPPLTNGTESKPPSVANESRKMTSNAKAQTNGNANGSQAKSGDARSVPIKGKTRNRQQRNANHVNGIVHQFNNMNGNSNGHMSESGTCAGTMKRQPPKLRRKG